MSIFADTSAIIAVLAADDVHHSSAELIWRELLDSGAHLITSNYVIVEAAALLQRRAGQEGIRRLLEEVTPAMSVEWVDRSVHEAGISGLMMTSKGGPNIVDCVSFALMWRLNLHEVFTFDRHFAARGFQVVGHAR